MTRPGIGLITGVLLMAALPQVLRPFLVAPSTTQENRPLAKAPAFPMTLDAAARWAGAAEAYLSDHFPLRQQVIGIVNIARYKMGYSGSSKVVVGRNGWLFYDDGAHSTTPMGELRLTKTGREDWLYAFGQRQQYLKARGIGFYILVAPTKESVYPEHRPHWMKRDIIKNEIDELIEAGQQQGIDQIVYPREALSRQRNIYVAWDEFDSHWTGPGAHIGYSALMNRVKRDYPQLSPEPIDRFTPRPDTGVTDLANMLGIAKYVQRERVAFASTSITDLAQSGNLPHKGRYASLQVLATKSPDKPTLLLLRDSFGSYLPPFLERHFGRIVDAQISQGVPSDQGFWPPDLIDAVQPDVVIVETIEINLRHAMRMLPVTPLADLASSGGARDRSSGGDCSIDAAKITSLKSADSTPLIEIQGWAALSTREGIAPETVTIVLKSRDGNERYARTRQASRPDVARHFKQTGLLQSGFTTAIDARGLSGEFEVTVLAKTRAGFIACPHSQRINLAG